MKTYSIVLKWLALYMAGYIALCIVPYLLVLLAATALFQMWGWLIGFVFLMFWLVITEPLDRRWRNWTVEKSLDEEDGAY